MDGVMRRTSRHRRCHRLLRLCLCHDLAHQSLLDLHRLCLRLALGGGRLRCQRTRHCPPLRMIRQQRAAEHMQQLLVECETRVQRRQIDGQVAKRTKQLCWIGSYGGEVLLGQLSIHPIDRLRYYVLSTSDISDGLIAAEP